MHCLTAITINSEPATLTDLLVPFIRWLIIVTFGFLSIKPLARRFRRNTEIGERVLQHNDAVAKKLDRIIETLDRGPV